MQISLRSYLLYRIFPFLRWWPDVNRGTLRADLVAGLTGSIIVLPQGIAFASIAGLPPVYGLYTAMVTPVIAALWGSSKHLVSGPTTAISLVIFATVGKLASPGTQGYIEAALAITFLAGVFQLALGIGRMGTLINFVSHVVVVGFTAGAALLIMLSQLKHLLGLSIPSAPSLAENLQSIVDHAAQINYYAVGIGLFTLLTAVVAKKYFPRIPNLLVALTAGSALAIVLGGENVGLRFVGEVHGALPPLHVPKISIHNFSTLAQSAFAIALLGLIEAVAIARSIATQSQQEIDNNQEFIGQGLSNIVGSFFSCYAGTGSFTRSGVNYAAGAKTPLAAIFAAFLLMLIVLFVAPLIQFLPIAGMAGVIMVVGYNLIDFRFMKTVLKASKRQGTVMIITFFSTLFLELEYAVFIGVLFSLIFYLQRTSRPNVAVIAPDPDAPNRRFTYLKRKHLEQCPQLKMLRIDDSIYFGSIAHISSEIKRLTDVEDPQVTHLLLMCKGVNFIDVAGSEWCVHEARRWKQKGGGLFFSGLKIIAQDVLIKGGFKKEIGEHHFFPNKEEAIPYVYALLNKDICAGCDKRIFLECGPKPTCIPVEGEAR